MTHELDVCIMTADAARTCRQSPDDPPASSVVAAFECKFYGSTLGKGLARAFLGLVRDMGTKVRISGFCSNESHPQMPAYFSPKGRPVPYLKLSPDDPIAEDRFVNRIADELKRVSLL